MDIFGQDGKRFIILRALSGSGLGADGKPGTLACHGQVGARLTMGLPISPPSFNNLILRDKCLTKPDGSFLCFTHKGFLAILYQCGISCSALTAMIDGRPITLETLGQEGTRFTILGGLTISGCGAEGQPGILVALGQDGLMFDMLTLVSNSPGAAGKWCILDAGLLNGFSNRDELSMNQPVDSASDLDGSPATPEDLGQVGKILTMLGALSACNFLGSLGTDGKPGILAFLGQVGTRTNIVFNISIS